ncbi:MAG: hypothetical protein MUF22_03485 [Chitinispirillaceae bacterium]|jgi:ADP-heptose:LPS heptosyltransferase|nr:hypothetical protein [Chitinispirillaceae bacterium]
MNYFLNMRIDHHVGYWRRLALMLMGRSNRDRILAALVKGRTKTLPDCPFPPRADTIKSVLIILPKKPLDALHQFQNIVEIRRLYKTATMTMLCESACVPIAAMIDAVEILSYHADELKLFSATYKKFDRLFHRTFDLCCLLSANDLPLLVLAGRTAAPWRIGFTGANTAVVTNETAFINHTVTPPPHTRYIVDRFRAMAGALGGHQLKTRAWVLSKQTTAEIDHMLRELGLVSATGLAGFDALHFYRIFGPAWTEQCLAAVLPFIKQSIYFIIGEQITRPEERWLAALGRLRIPSLSVPQTAALANRSAIIVTGNTLLFGLGTITGTRMVGIFPWHELPFFCPAETPEIRGVSYGTAPDTETIANVVTAMTELTASL